MGGWMPGATVRHGAGAGYAKGRNAHRTTVCHYTVGRDSTAIGDRGYFNFLCRRNGEIVQFAESDAVTWHAGNWNTRGPGIEVEYLESYDGPAPANIFTGPQLQAAGKVCNWLKSQGMPGGFYDGGRVADYSGFITHRSLIQSGDWHYDYWTAEQFNAAVAGGGGAPEPPKPKGEGMLAIDEATGIGWHWGVGWAHWVTSQKQYQELKYVGNQDLGVRNMYVIAEWMDKYGAWAQNGTPRRIEYVMPGG